MRLGLRLQHAVVVLCSLLTALLAIAVLPALASPAHAATGTYSGTKAVGSTLHANPGIWQPSGVTFTYQWYRSGVAVTVLSERQRQVLRGRARGLSHGRIARDLYVGESTLRGYRQDIAHAPSLYIADATPAEVERHLGLAPGDLLELWQWDDDEEWCADPALDVTGRSCRGGHQVQVVRYSEYGVPSPMRGAGQRNCW